MAHGDDFQSLQNKHRRIIPTCTIRKLADLMGNPISTTLTERLIRLLEDLLYSLPCGFWGVDITYATEIIQHLINKSEKQPEYEPYLYSLLKLCEYPPLLTRSDEMLYISQDMIEYFNFFGYILVTVENECVKGLVINSLRKLMKSKKNISCQALPLPKVKECIEASNLIEAACNLIIQTEDDASYEELLKLIHDFAKISEDVCCKMLQENVVEYVIIRMDSEWKTRLCSKCVDIETQELKHVDESLDLLTVLVSAARNAPKGVLAEVKSTKADTLWCSRYILRALHLNPKTKVERNFFLSILLELERLFEMGYLETTCITIDIYTLIRIKPVGTWAGLVPVTPDNLSCEFIRLLLIGVEYSLRSPRCSYEWFKCYKVMASLLKLLNPEDFAAWSPEHCAQLRCDVLTVLERILVNSIHTFVEENGVLRILDILNCPIQKMYDFDVLKAALKLIYRIVLVTSQRTVLELFVGNEVVSKLINIVETLLEARLNSDNQTVMELALSIITVLLKLCEVLGILNLALKLMRRALEPKPEETVYGSRLMITVVNLVWDSINMDESCSKYFIENEGVFLLLDVMQDGVHPVKVVTLGCLVDLIDNTLAIPFLLTWRRKKQTFIEMLMHTFRDENSLIGVKIDYDGVLEDAEFPIMGKTQRQLISTSIEESAAIKDMYGSIRPKIYAILQIIESQNATVEIVDDYYRLNGLELKHNEKMMKPICDNYLALKIGEVWMEVKQYFDSNNLNLVPFDFYFLNRILQNFKIWATDVRNLQLQLLKMEYRKGNIKEETFYNLLREAKLQSSLEALNELRILARSMSPRFREEHYKAVASSLKIDSDIHRTVNVNARVFAFNQTMNLESDVIIDPFKELPPEPISPNSVCMNPEEYDEEASHVSVDVPKFERTASTDLWDCL